MEISIITRDQFNHSIQLLSKSPYVKENLDLVNNLLNYDRNVSLLSLLYTCFEQFNSLSNTIFQQCQDYLANRSDNAPAFGRIFRYVSQRATGKGTGAVGSPYLPHRVPNIMFEDYFSCIMELSNVIVFLLREYSLRGDIFTIYLTEQTKNFSEIRKFQYLYYEPLLQVDSTMFYDGEKSAFSSLCNSFLYSWGKILHAFFIDGVNHLIESIRVDNVHFQSTMDYVFDLLTDLLQFPREEFHLGSYRKSKFCDEIYLRLVTTLGTAHPNRLRELLKRWFVYQPSQPSEQPILYFLKTLKVAFNQLLLNGIEVLDFLTKSKITQLNVHSSKIQEEVKNLLKNIINHTSFTLDVGQQLMNDCFSDKRLEITSKKSHIYLFEPYEIPSEIYIHIFRLILKNGFVEEFNANAVVEEIVIYFNSVNSNKDYFFFEFLKVLNKDEEQKLLVEKNNSNQVNEIVLQLVKKLLFYYLEQQCWEPLLKIFEVLSGVLQSNKHSRNNGIKLWLSQEKDLLINIPIFLMNHQKNMTVWQLNSFRLNYPFDLIDFQILFELPDNSLKKLKIFQFMNFFSTDDSRTKSSYIQPKIELLFYIFHHFEGYQGITPTTLLLCREEESPNNRNEGFEELTDLLKEMKIEEKNDDSLDAWLIKYLQSFYSPSNHCDDIIFNKFKEYCSLTWFYSLKKRVLTIIKTVCYEEKTKNALRELIIIENYKNEIEKININTFPVLFYSFLSYRRNEVEDKFICFLYFYLMKVKKPFLIFYDKETLNINQLNFQENLINNIICSKYFIPIISINTIRAIREEQSHHDLYEDNVLLEWITAINCLLLQEKYCQKHEEYSNSIPCRIIYPIFYQNDSHIDLFQSTDYQNILQSTIIPKKTLQMAKNIIEKKYKLPFLLDEKNLTISEIMNDIIKKAGFVLKYYDYSSLQQLFEKFENPQFFT